MELFPVYLEVLEGSLETITVPSQTPRALKGNMDHMQALSEWIQGSLQGLQGSLELLQGPFEYPQ